MDVFIFVFLILLAAFFSASETAIFSVSKFKLHSLVREKRSGSTSLAKLKANPNKLLATILIGVTLVEIFTASYATFLATKAFGEVGIGIATGIITVVLLVFAESLPKTLAAHNSTQIALLVSRPLEWFSIIIAPLVKLLESFTSIFTRAFTSDSVGGVTEEELKAVIAVSREAGVLEADAAEIMENVIEFEDVRVSDVMTPEVSVIYLDGEKRLNEAINTIIKTDYSRFPVFLDSEENIIGVFDSDLALKQIQKRSWNTKIKEVVMPPFIVPENKKVSDLLSDFAKNKTKFALVVDEHGSFDGVVSLEDVLEEIVGDIFDKSLKIEKMVKPVAGGLEIKGSARVDDLEKILRISMKGEGFTTIAGLIETQLGRIPKIGEKISLKNFEVEVEEADEKSIKKIRLYHSTSSK